MKFISRLLTSDGAAGSGKSNAAPAATNAAPPAAAPSQGQPPAEAGSEAPASAASPETLDPIEAAIAEAHGWKDEEADPNAAATEGGSSEADPNANSNAETGEGEGETDPNGDPNAEGGEGDPNGDPNAETGKEKQAAGAETIETVKTENAQLKEQIAKLQRPIVQPTAEMPLAHIETPEQLAATKRHAQSILEFCESNPDGTTIQNDKGEDVVLTAEDIRARKVSAMRIVNAVPDREKFLQVKAGNEAEAKVYYPQLYQAGSTEATRAASVRQAIPWINTLPNADLIIGDALVGEAIRLKRYADDQAKKKGGKAQASAPGIKPPVNPGTKAVAAKPPIRPPASQAPARPGAARKLDDARKNVKTGQASESDVDALIEAQIDS